MKLNLTIKKQFIIFFLLVAAASLLLLSAILRAAIEKCFHDYVWSAQGAAHDAVVTYLEDYYGKRGTWKDFDGRKIGEAAKKESCFFTLYDPRGRLIWTTENHIEPCCSNPAHKYLKNIYPIMAGDIMVARVNIGQFTDHIYSPEDAAFRQSLIYGIGLSLIITLLVALPLSLVLSSRLSKPVRELKEAADAMSRGDMTAELKNSSSIEEISSLTDSINQLRRSLIEQENLRKQLTTNISHELRTPLNVMQNQIEGMTDGVLPLDKERLEGILKEIQRLTGLIGELEKITEAESDALAPVYEKTDLSETAEAAAAGFEGAFRRKGLSLIREIEPGVIIKARKDKLIQVILNLISNAYKFTDAGSVTVKVSREEKKAVFEVTDTGRGIEEKDMKNIFERFYRVEKSRNRDMGGAGLGLAIVRKIADAHGWKIEAASVLNKGSSFRIFI